MAPLETEVVKRYLKQLRRGVASPEDADRTLGEVKDAVVNDIVGEQEVTYVFLHAEPPGR
jgi:hypothetical protein